MPWQTSSSTSSPRRSAMSMIASMLQAAPHMWTGMIALVCGPIASRIASGLIVIVSSMSTMTGIAPTASTAVAVAI